MKNIISRVLLNLIYALNPSVLCQQTRQTTSRGDLSLNLCECYVFGGVFQDVTVHYYGRHALVSNPVHVVSTIYAVFNCLGVLLSIYLFMGLSTIIIGCGYQVLNTMYYELLRLRDSVPPTHGQSSHE